MQKFVKIQQTYTLKAIMDVNDNEDEKDIVNRIKEYCKINGGVDEIIVCGGEITAQITNEIPSEEDYEMYECID